MEDSEDCYIDLFLTNVVIPYSGPYVSNSLTRDTLSSSGRPLTSTPRASWLLDCNSETDRICRGYPCINNFITPMRSSGCQLTWSSYTHRLLVFRYIKVLPVWKNPWLTTLSKVNIKQMHLGTLSKPVVELRGNPFYLIGWIT